MPHDIVYDPIGNRWQFRQVPAEAQPAPVPEPQPDPIQEELDRPRWFNIPAGNQLDQYARALLEVPPGLVKRKRNIKPPPPPEIPAYEAPKDYTMTTPAYYMPYDTLDEVNLRLVQSIIRLHGQAVYIVEAIQDDGKFHLWFKKTLHGDVFKHVYEEGSGFDLSPFKSRYIDIGGYGYWTYRRPIRGCYKQGACSKNTFMRMVGKERDEGLSVGNFLTACNNPLHITQVMDGIKKIRQQRDNGNAFLNTALSPDVALFYKDKAYRVEYKGTPIGVFDEERNVLRADTPEITANIWAIRRLDAVGIVLG